VPADRAALLRHAAAALAATNSLPRHPRWRFAFLSYLTTDPLFVALQYGLQDATALTGCVWTWGGSANGDPLEVAKAVDAAVDEKVDGIAVPLLDSQALEDATARATVAGIPVVALNARATLDLRLPFVGLRPEAVAHAIAARVLRKLHAGTVAVFVGERELVGLRPLAERLLSALGRGGRLGPKLVTTGADIYAQLDAVVQYVDMHPGLPGAVALDSGSTEGLALALNKLAPGQRAPLAVGAGVLPAALKLVADGSIEFTVDQQPYQQGFVAALQLFLTKLSGGLLQPADVPVSPIFVTRANVGTYLNTRTRFEGSSSRQRYPIG